MRAAKDPAGDGSRETVRGRRRGRRSRLNQLGQTEVQDLDLAVPAQPDVLGLDVPMDDPRLMRSGEAEASWAPIPAVVLQGKEPDSVIRSRSVPPRRTPWR